MNLIIVEGPKSSGKTSSIKLACKKLGLDFTGSPVADIQCVAKFRLGRTNRLIGIGSAGDDSAAIRANLLFFKDHDLAYAICACSAPREGRPLLDAFATLHGATVTQITTRKLDRATKESIALENEKVAEEIINAVNAG
ncbi:hypothetical protein [Sphingopyxis terrae]|uniref:hypothetical protein n=1 Tax=Sphingopyxis terrae TaxID=33052 RepID=UPI002A0D8132|nr:hypothetical protein [Sphingopyxis terrae]MDX8356130.1 hypothetical protein [Sphingopyxis terrae]